MKFKSFFVIIVLVLSGQLLFGQVSIGSPLPDGSAQLDVVASNKGILIPRIAIQSTSDITTIANPALGLLVFASQALGDITPGFYYWNGSQWNRFRDSDLPDIVTTFGLNADGFTLEYSDESGTTSTVDLSQVIDSFESVTTLSVNPDNVHLDYLDEDGTTQQIDLTSLVENLQTLTTIVENTDGTFTYTDENGDPQVIDIKNLETVTTLALNADGFTLEYTDEDGTTTPINLSALVNSVETLTTIVENTDGTFTYTDENGAPQVIDIKNLETVTTLALNADGFTLEYTDEDGTNTPINLSALVNSVETLTTIVENTDGTFTYTDENGAPQVIDIKNLETVTTLALNADDTNLDYTDENGTTNQINLTSLVKNLETLTTLVQDDVAGTLTYTGEDGTPVVVDLNTLIDNSETLTTLALNADDTNLDYTDENGTTNQINLTSLVKNLETLTTLVQDDVAGTLTYTGEDGTPVVVDLNTLIDNSETLTTLALNADGFTLEYTDENGVVTSVNLQTIIDTYDNQDLSLTGTTLNITNGAGVDLTGQLTLPMLAPATTATSGIYWDGSQWNYQVRVATVNNKAPDASGNVSINIGQVYTGATFNVNDITANEIPGTPSEGDIYVVNSDATDPTQVGKTYIWDADSNAWVEIDPFNASLYDGRYVNVNGDTMVGTLDMSGNTITSVANPINTDDAANKSYVDLFTISDLIAGSKIATVTKSDGTVQEINQTVTSLEFDNTTGILTYTDESGATFPFDLPTIVATAETITTLVQDDVAGTLTYTGEDGIPVVIDLNDLIDNAETLTVLALNGDNTNLDYTDENGTTNQINLTSLVKNLETVTTLVENTNGTFTYTSEDGTTTTVDINNLESLTSLVLNADNTNLDYTDENGTTNQINLTSLVKNLETLTTLVQDDVAGTLTYTGEDGTPVVVDLNTLIDNSETLTTLALNADDTNLDYTDENGTTNQINLTSLVKNLETLTTLVQDDVAGTLTYTGEDGTPVVVDLNTLIDNSETLTTLALNADGFTLEYTDENGVVTSINLQTIIDTYDNQGLSLTGTTLNITNGTGVDLTGQLTLPMLAPATTANSGIYWDGSQWNYQVRVATVNNKPPDSDGNVNINVGQVYTGPTSNVNDITANEIPGTPNEGDIYVVNSDATDATQVGKTYIWDADSSSSGAWVEIDPFNATLYDGRYVNITGDTMVGVLNMGDNTITKVANPINTDDAANKAYVDLFTISDLIAGSKIATITKSDGTEQEINQTVTVLNITTNNNGTPGDTNDDFQELTYRDEDGTINSFNLTTVLAATVANTETLTSLVRNADDTNLDYTDEDGTLNKIDLTPLVKELETDTFISNDATAGTITYTGEDGTPVTITVAGLASNTSVLDIGNNFAGSDVETVLAELFTAISSSSDGVITDASTTGTVLTIERSIGADITVDLESLVKAVQSGTSLTLNADDTNLDYTNNNGVTTQIDLTSLVKELETDTFISNDATAGTITYTGEDGTPVTITVAGLASNTSVLDIGNNFAGSDVETVLAELFTAISSSSDGVITDASTTGTVLTIERSIGADITVDLESLVKAVQSGTSLTLNADDTNLDYTNNNGVTTQIDLTSLVKELETDTFISNDATAGTITYTGEDGTPVTITVAGLASNTSVLDIGNNFAGSDVETVLAELFTAISSSSDGVITDASTTGTVLTIERSIGADITVDLESLVKAVQSGTSLTLNADDTNLDYTNNNGVTTQIDLTSLVKELETDTFISNDATAGTITYTGEDGTPVTITVAGLASNTSVLDIGNNFAGSDVETVLAELFTAISSSSDGVITGASTAGTELTITRSAGADITVDLESLVKAVQSGTSLTLNADDTNLDYTDNNGVLNQIDLTPLVKELETKTSISITTNNNGTPGNTNDDFQELSYQGEGGMFNINLNTTLTPVVTDTETITVLGVSINDNGTPLDLLDDFRELTYQDEQGNQVTYNIGNVVSNTINSWENDPANSRINLTNLSDGSTARPAGTQVVITDTGNVGIGTTSPDAKLDVRGTNAQGKIVVSNGSSSNLASDTELGTIGFAGQSGGTINTSAEIKGVYTGDGSTNSGAIQFNTVNNGTSTNAMYIAENGNTGIGTNDPTSVLKVNSDDSGIVIPRVANTAAVANPENGMFVFDMSEGCFKGYGGGAWTDCWGAPQPSELTANCDANGFTGSYVATVPVSGASFSVTLTNNGLSASTAIAFNASNLTLSGVSGLTVGTPSPASHTFSALGEQVTVSYPITGTPASTGTVQGDWSLLTFAECTRTVNVGPGDATFASLPVTKKIVSVSVSSVPVIQGIVDNATNQITFDVPFTGGVGNYDAYTSAPLSVMGEGGDTNNLTYSYPAGSFSSGTGTIPVTITVDGDGSLNVPLLEAGTEQVFASLDFQVNGDSKGALELQAISGVPDRNFGDGVHDFLYFDVVAENGTIWLNNNLGAHYADVNHPSFDPQKQATSVNDYLAFGSLFQWGRPADGHELMTWTSSSSGTPVNPGTTTTLSSTTTPGHSDYIWNSSQNNWTTAIGLTGSFNWGESTENPCPEGYSPGGQPNTNPGYVEVRDAAGGTLEGSVLKFTQTLVRGISSNSLTSSERGYWRDSRPADPTQAAYYRLSDQSGGIKPRRIGAPVRCMKTQ